MFWWTLLVPQSSLFPDTYTSASMFDIFSLKILEGGIFILFLYVYFSKLPFSPFIWRKAKAPVLWLTFPMNTDFPKRLLFSLIAIFTLESHPLTLQVVSHLNYGDDFRDADFLNNVSWIPKHSNNFVDAKTHLTFQSIWVLVFYFGQLLKLLSGLQIFHRFETAALFLNRPSSGKAHLPSTLAVWLEMPNRDNCCKPTDWSCSFCGNVWLFLFLILAYLFGVGLAHEGFKIFVDVTSAVFTLYSLESLLGRPSVFFEATMLNKKSPQKRKYLKRIVSVR